MGPVQLDTKIKLNYFCNISYSFFLKQIYHQILVKGNYGVLQLYKLQLQFSLDNLCLTPEGARLCYFWYFDHDSQFLFFQKVK